MLNHNAFSQVWDSKWFKFKGKAHGYVVEEPGNSLGLPSRGKVMYFFIGTLPIIDTISDIG